MAETMTIPVPRRAELLQITVAAMIAVLANAAAGPTSAYAADSDGQMTIGGRVRTYSMHVPDRPAPRAGFPLLLAFHGGGGDGAAMRRLTGFDALADQRGFIVVYPNGVDRHWNDGRATIRNPQDDVGFVSALIDQFAAHQRIDRSRIFATGLSNGALFAERLGCDLSGRIAAIAPVAGTLPVDTSRNCRPAHEIAVLQIDGTADPIMPYGGGSVADFGHRGEGGQVLSVAATANFWARQNGCTSPGAIAPLPPTAAFDRTCIIARHFARCPAAAPVDVLTVVGGGHTWPGGPQYAPALVVGRTSRQVDASRSIVDFFLGLPPA